MIKKTTTNPIKGKALGKTKMEAPSGRITKSEAKAVSKIAKDKQLGKPIPYKGKGEVKFNPTITGKQIQKTKPPSKITKDEMNAVNRVGQKSKLALNKKIKERVAKRESRKETRRQTAAMLAYGAGMMAIPVKQEK